MFLSDTIMDKYNVQNKTVMITGGATGLGYKYAEILLRNGAKSVAIIDLSTSNGQKAAINLETEFGKGRVVFLVCDVTKAEDLEKTFKKVIDTFKGLDILINNAGILNDKCWEQTIDLNIKAVIRGTLLALDYMGKHKGGKGGVIVNVASIAGLHPFNSFPIYCASKHAILGFSQSLADTYNKTGLRIVIMCPGVTTTAIIENLKNKTIDVIDSGILELNKLPRQPVDNVAHAMLDLIQKGKNGTVWVCENGQLPYAVDFPHYSKRSLPV